MTACESRSALSDSVTESVRIYVITPTRSLSPMSTPSYNFWAICMVRLAP
jgi:hypothetical protein